LIYLLEINFHFIYIHSFNALFIYQRPLFFSWLLFFFLSDKPDTITNCLLVLKNKTKPTSQKNKNPKKKKKKKKIQPTPN